MSTGPIRRLVGRRRASTGALRPRSSDGSHRVWYLTLGLALLAAGLYLFWVFPMTPPSTPVRIPFWILAILFLLAEINVTYVQVRRDGFMFSLSEVPLVLGMFFSTIDALVGAQLLGAGLVLAFRRRQPPVKLFFNLSHLALEAVVAFGILHALGGSSPLGPVGWTAAIVAVLVISLLADLTVWLAIGLADGDLRLATIREGFGFGKVSVLTNTTLGLGAAVILWRDPQAAWLQLVPAATVVFAYRAYTVQRRRHEGLESLYDSSRAVQRSVRLETLTRELLARAREMFRVEMAEVTFFAQDGEEEATVVRLGADGEVRERHVRLDPTRGVWARVASEDRALRLSEPISNERLRAFFKSEGIRDLMVAPLHAEAGVVGVIRAANRQGVGTFDDDDLRLFDTLASHASVALENARLVGRLEESLEHLSEVNRMKDDFISTVSHELRTPLTVMQGSVKTLLRADVTFDEEQQRTFLEAAERSGERLHQLIEQLLMVSRFESGTSTLDRGPVSLPSLVVRVTEELESRRNGHSLDSRVEPAIPILITDGPKLHQILSNLVENALKYSPPNTTVLVRAEQRAEGIQLSVIDEGDGIPEEFHESIFDR
ncbi:MAG TPA: histidine kinase dimerization/phospho-acceptor domain-containing protein, partial [Actinomycetota bacterium]|nr:histidine kinase dimerization/phospho-acceptor domain-containing protein [Actinomycetota bacterium]